ncbi:MAG: GTP cyclohydrolase I FolE [Lachnospiraceae bacterium]|jgi:GTP cyclohydrolase I|nr:GTP cyclohydrolase I FolE [Lachnospiraceae bacterium]
MDDKKIIEGVKLILEGIGEDVNREGLLDTPERIARMYHEIAGGYEQNASDQLVKRFHVDTSDIVIEKDITFYSMCEHHMLPFYGKVAIAYIPNDEVVGLSKLARLVEVYAKRLQVQERLTCEVADALMKELNPKGVMVYIEAEHMCMTMRGIKKPGSKTTTFVSRGEFKDNKELRDTFFDVVHSKRHFYGEEL